MVTTTAAQHGVPHTSITAPLARPEAAPDSACLTVVTLPAVTGTPPGRKATLDLQHGRSDSAPGVRYIRYISHTPPACSLRDSPTGKVAYATSHWARATSRSGLTDLHADVRSLVADALRRHWRC